MKKWLLQTKILSGKGLNQVKVKELMKGGFSEENIDELNVAVSTLIEAGETKEYTDNVYLKLGVFEGENKEGAFGAYVDAFNGDDQNELFFMHQIEALELAGGGCSCGGKCSGHIDESKEEQFILESDGIANLESAIARGELFVREKVSVWTERRYKIEGDATPESLVEDLNSKAWRHWNYDSKDTEEYLDDTQEPIDGAGTLEVYTANNGRIGGN